MTYVKIGTRRYVMTARAAKAGATKARILASAKRLYCERAIEDFTLEEVAKHAGTTVQTLLRAFGSKEHLVYAALADLAAGGVPLKPTPPGNVSLAVRHIYDIYEGMGDLVMQRLNDERRHPALRPSLEQGRKNHRDGVRTIFAPQLARQSGAARAQLFNILVAATDVYVWKLLRRDMALSRPAAEAVVCRMIDGVTKPEGKHGEDLMAELVRRREPAS